MSFSTPRRAPFLRDPEKNTMTEEGTYNPDPSHPIPDVSTCDVRGVRKGGGADLFIVIALPMQSDERSQHRLMRKMENYLGYIRSDSFRDECGAPSPETTRIIVKIHEQSSPPIFDLIQQCNSWVADNNASLLVEPLPITHRRTHEA